MKASTFLLISEVLLILAIVLVFSGFHGSTGFNLGWPLSQFEFKIIGEAHGGAVALTFACLLVATVTFVAGVVAMLKKA